MDTRWFSGIVIDCEIHTQLLTKTKAFCTCENRTGGIPDTRVCPVCLGLQGAMPRISNGYVHIPFRNFTKGEQPGKQKCRDKNFIGETALLN